MQRAPAHTSSLVVIAAALVAVAASSCTKGDLGPPPRAPPSAIVAVATTPPDMAPVDGQDVVLGNGWYANVEIDDDERVHLAWVDADRGDVLYAAIAPGETTPGDPVVVEHEGAVGSYLRLALAPGGAPVFSYYHQDEKTLRLAHRSADLPLLAARGVVVDTTPPAAREPVGGARMGPGFVGEDVTYGDHVGMGGALAVDDAGVPHLVYYAKGMRFRYARREPAAPAFGPAASGRFVRMDVDREGGSSYTMRADLVVADAGLVVTSYCNWTFKDASLKVATLAPGATAFDVVSFGETGGSDGWQSTLLDDGAAGFRVFSVAIGDQRLYASRVRLAPLARDDQRSVILERPAAAVVKQRKDGTLVVLARQNGLDPTSDPSGVWLIEVPSDDTKKPTRLLLDEGASSDPWLDLALRRDGRPVAVWTSSDHREMRLYAP